MLKDYFTHIRNFTKAYLFLPAITGVLTGLWVFMFRVVAGKVIDLSADIYSLARNSYLWVCIILASAVLLGVVVSFILKYSPQAKGGGIPTAVAALRGFITFNWVKTLLGIFTSSMITYFVGVPLGTEGPSVQMGTAIGNGVVSVFGKKSKALNRYIMTSGTTAGFAVATGAPFAGTFFALEEAHRRFSPTIIMTALVGAMTGYFTSSLLSKYTGVSLALFDIHALEVFPLEKIWIPIVIGVLTGLFAIGIFAVYKLLRGAWGKLSKIPLWMKISGIFVVVAVCGLIWSECLFTGHSLMEAIFENHVGWKLLIVFFAIRCVLGLFSNNAGITGGLFIPILAWGAIIGALYAKAFIHYGLMDEALYLPVVVVSVAACLGAVYKTPVTAVIFSVEVLGGISNIPYVLVAVGVAYIVTEFFSVSSMNDLVIETKLDNDHRNKIKREFEASLQVMEGAFVIGKETGDVLWPAGCFIFSIEHKNGIRDKKMHGGDIINMHFSTYDVEASKEVFTALLGEQDIDSALKCVAVRKK